LNEAPIQTSAPTGQDKTFDAKITKLVDEIAKLTLLEVADLNELLKKRLNIPDTPMMGPISFAAGPAAAPAEVSCGEGFLGF
jgi:large subunit ribosomal protein L7/L12